MHVDPLVFLSNPLKVQVRQLYTQSNFIVSIRYYGYKINLYLLGGYYFEIFYNHKEDKIEKIQLLDFHHSRMKFYYDQITLPILAS